MARWLNQQFGVDAVAVRDLGMLQAKDGDIFKARAAGAVVVTKDRDFVALLEAHGSPPQVVWITCGNTSNARLQGEGLLTCRCTRRSPGLAGSRASRRRTAPSG